jgi:hypothetical protein
LISELIFYEHDLIIEEAIEHYVNLAKHPWKKGKIGTYLARDNSFNIINIQTGISDELFFNAKIANRSIDVTMIEDLRNAAQIAYSRGEMSFEDLVKTYNTQSISQLEEMLKDYTTTLRSMEAEQQMSVEQMKAKLKQDEIRLSKEYDMAIKQMGMEIEAQKLNIEKVSLELEKNRILAENKLADKKIESDQRIKEQEIQTERDVESAYLQEQKRASMVDERLRSIELRLNALAQNAEIVLSKKSIDVKNKDAGIKKATLQERQNKKSNKEKIKD